MEILKYRIIVIAILIFVVLKINAQEIDFKVGDSHYEGAIKSASIFEYHRLKEEKVNLTLDKVPKVYKEFNEAGKLVCEVRNSENKSFILSNDYDALDNIRYQITHKFPYTKDRNEFLKKKKIFEAKLKILLDSLKEGHSLQNNDEIVEIEKFYYDHPTLSITKVSRRSLQPTIWKVDILGNVIYQENYLIQRDATKKQVVERQYLGDKIIYEVSDAPDQKIYQQYLYDVEGNLSNKIVFNDQAAMLKHHIHTYGKNKEMLKIFDGENNLVSKMIKESTNELVTYTYFKIYEKGVAQIIKKETEYIDGFGNVIKREVKNIGFDKVYVTEYIFEYYL